MKTIQINRSNILSTPQNYEFIPIGNPDRIFGNGGFLDQLKDRIFKRNKAPLSDFWATLGRQDGKPIDWTGSIVCSADGNTTSTGVTGEEVDTLKQIMPSIQETGKRAQEKVLVFDNVQFGNDPASRQIRLTLMVDVGEGALVYYQHTDKSDALSQEGIVEYVQPSPTANYSNNMRDRLDYFFEVPEALGPDDRFIIKAITFARNTAETPETVLHRVENPYRLLKYNPETNGFDEITNGIPAADRSLKTLLLIHGTFSTTAKSYYGLIDSGWLKTVIDTKLYDQVLAFDHPTVLAGPAENVEKLLEFIGPGPKFSQKIAVITTSRGGLVGKTLVNDVNIDKNIFSVERVAAQACANGVAYFTTGAQIVKGLAVLKQIFKMAGLVDLSIFTAIAETSADFFLAQPGCVAMTPGSAPLTAILNGVPANPAMRYFPVTGNYSPDSATQKIANLFIKGIYKDEPNDWVVGTKQQAIMPEANYAYGQTKKWGYDYYLNNTFDSIHTKYLGMGDPAPYPRLVIMEFLKDDYANIL